MHPEVGLDEPRRRSPSASSSQQTIDSGELCENANSPPGRSSRAASGTVRYGSPKVMPPWSQKTTSKLASGNGTSSALACTSGKSTPAASIS